MKKETPKTSDNLTIYRVVAMTMVILYHCACYDALPHWSLGECPYNLLLKNVTTSMGYIHMPVFVFILECLYWSAVVVCWPAVLFLGG